jgi:sugar/nucleoside kinase (ribokinase family)
MTIWVHGPSAWDTVIEVEKYPNPGDFLPALGKSERPGGSGLNVALALASTDSEVGFITYLGDDEHGAQIRSLLIASAIQYLDIHDFAAPTLHALIIKDTSGERTIIALETTQFRKLVEPKPEIATKIKSGDIFIFAIWRAEFKPLLSKLNSMQVITLVGANALEDSEVKATVAIGSKKDISKTFQESNLAENEVINRFEKIVLTDGSNGAQLISGNLKINQPALVSEVVDATGAGDSFLAGYSFALSQGLSNENSLFLASAWAASAVAINSSLPPKWSEVSKRWDL